MPPWLQAVVLGVVQGLTEFIPISSSAHLVLVPYLAGWDSPGLAFDVALHLGTAAAVVVFFRKELAAMARGLLGRSDAPDALLYRRLGLLVVVGSVPVAVAGLLLEDVVAEAFTSPVAVAAALLATASLLWAAERRRDRRVAATAAATPAATPAERVGTGDWRGQPHGSAPPLAGSRPALPTGADPDDPLGQDLHGLGLREALLVGAMQMAALLPGVSRSGSTITAGIFAGLTREAAARFSFLLSLPALLGAFVLSLDGLAEPGPYSGAAIAGGVLASFAAGYAAIRFLVRLVARDRLTGFAVYCVALAIVAVLAYSGLGPPAGA